MDFFLGDTDEDVKMNILSINQWPLKYAFEKNIWYPDCMDEFEVIGELKQHNKKYQLSCFLCGTCVKDRKVSEHTCSSECVFDKKTSEQRRLNPLRKSAVYQ